MFLEPSSLPAPTHNRPCRLEGEPSAQGVDQAELVVLRVQHEHVIPVGLVESLADGSAECDQPIRFRLDRRTPFRTTEPGCDLRVVAYHMTQFIGSVGHLLTPPMRAELHRMAASQPSG